MSHEQLNYFAKLQWRDPAITLAKFRALEIATQSADISPKVRRLRTNALKHVREERDGALFSHGLAAATGHKVYFANLEQFDYDFVTTWTVGNVRHYCPVQLKEVPPEDLAPNQSLKVLLNSFGKYQRTNTVLAVLLNQPAELPTDEIFVEAIPFAQVWLFWCASADQQEWVVQGDILQSAAQYHFTYPLSWGNALS